MQWARGLLIILGTLLSSPALAGFTCGGPLTDAQSDGFKHLFSPTYEPALKHMGGQIKPENFSKTLSAAGVAALSVDKPLVAASATLDQSGAAFLKKALNDNSQNSVPGWVSTAIGVFIPVAWVGVSADVMLQLINGAGDAGRLSLSNLAGTVGPGGNVAVLQRVGKGDDGSQKYIWAFSYTATLNGQPTTALLYVCIADIFIVP